MRCNIGWLPSQYRSDKSDLWAIISATSLFNESGRYIGVLEIITDISDRKQVEAGLQREMQRSQLLADITLKIRQSLQFKDILQTTVKEVQALPPLMES
ncbi:MAG: hypothetical protein MJA27_24440 [Pseudanabaenales cyanobacterium]|nr:hypothetical protein [Pseudanabaenales cyanobacterium]